MIEADRSEFESHARVLFAGCNLPATPERIEAFWRGLSQMPLSGFVRTVNYVLGPQGPDDLQKITTHRLYQIYRYLRAQAEHQQNASPQTGSLFESFTDRLKSEAALRRTMPKTKDGFIVGLEYLPAPQRAALAAQWRKWHDEHPGASEINKDSCMVY